MIHFHDWIDEVFFVFSLQERNVWAEAEKEEEK